MPLSVDWPNKFITVPKSELTLIEGTRYKITVSYWWQLLREANATEEGIPFDTMYNNTPPTSSTPRIVDLINGYTAEFEDGLYSVELVDGNTNWRDIEVKNTVSVGTNNTTGFIDPTFLEAGLFTEGVILDVIDGVAGIGKTASGGIIGTRQTPSNNLADANIIAQFRGTRTLVIVNSMPIAGEDLSAGYTLTGDSPFTLVTLEPSAILNGCSLRSISATGEMDGMNSCQDVFLLDVTAASGVFRNCAFGGSMVLNGPTDMFDCYSRVVGGGYPTFTVGSNALVVRNHRGSFGLDGAVAGHVSSIGVHGGRLIVEDTNTGGEVHTRGQPFEVIDNSGVPGLVIDERESDKVRMVHGQVGRSVYVDTELVTNGDGSQQSPFNNITDAIDYAEEHSLKRLTVLSDVVIDRQIKNFVITGVGTPAVDTNNKNLDKSEIIHCTVTGNYNGRLTVQECHIMGQFTLNGFVENCAIGADLVVPSGGIGFIKDCSVLVTDQVMPEVDVGGVAGSADLVITGYDGGLKVVNVNNPTDSVKLVMGTSTVVLDATCTDGTINVGGQTHLVDNSQGSTVIEEVLDPHYLTHLYQAHYYKRVWDKGANTVTVYDEDGVTPLHEFDTNADLSIMVPG